MRHAVAALLAFVLGAGAATVSLAGGPPPADDDLLPGVVPASTAPSPLPAQDLLRGLGAPEWREGYAWTLHFAEPDWSCRVVVVDADAEGYLQGWACGGAQVEAARLAAYPQGYLGRLAPDLSGVTDEERTVWFSWPLHDGKTWNTTWWGTEYEVAARFVAEVEGPLGPEPGFELTATAREGDGVDVSYDYVPSLAWWSRFELDTGWAVHVTAFEPAWSGVAHTGVAEPLLDARAGRAATTDLTAASSFEMGPDADLLVFHATLRGAHQVDVELRGPDGGTRFEQSRQVLSLGGAGAVWAFLPGEEGSWEVRVQGVVLTDSRYRAWGVATTEWEL